MQLVTEAQKSNKMMKDRNEQLQVMTAENPSLKTRMEQMEANEHIRQQELIKQCQKIAKLEGVIKNLSDQLKDQENRYRRHNLRIIVLPEKTETSRNLDIIIQEIIQENALLSFN